MPTRFSLTLPWFAKRQLKTDFRCLKVPARLEGTWLVYFDDIRWEFSGGPMQPNHACLEKEKHLCRLNRDARCSCYSPQVMIKDGPLRILLGKS